MLAQFGGGDFVSTLIWFLLFFIFIIYGPRLMTTQTIWKLEKDVADLEILSSKTRDYVVRKIEKKPGAKLKQDVLAFMDFFAVSPVDLDPYGIIRKLDMVVRQSDARFRMFVDKIAPKFSVIEKNNIKNALAGAMTTHQIAKIVRHLLEIIKKYKIFQLALILQMQFPLIARIARAASAATYTFVDGMPIGDGIGPMVSASLVPAKAKVKVFKEEEFAIARTTVNGRPVLVAKADGPGGGTGYPGKFLLKVFRSQKIDRIITVDAALRLEGEKAGSIAEGVGVAMGGTGVDRYEIEELALKYKIPLDAIAIKVSDEEALQAMPKIVADAVPAAIEKVKETVGRTRRGKRILVIGVGNTCGIGNSAPAVKEALNKLAKYRKRIKPEKEEKKGWF